MKTFDDLTFDRANNMGHARLFFDNGYGVSVIRHEHSYGGPEGKFEIAVLTGDAGDWNLTYRTPLTDDVIGWLEPEQVTDLLRDVQELPREDS